MQFGLENVVVELIRYTLKSHDCITAAKIYGSRAVGNYRPNSDIDIAVFGDIDHYQLGKIKASLEALPTPYKFDVTAYSRIRHQPLKDHVDNDGIELSLTLQPA